MENNVAFFLLFCLPGLLVLRGAEGEAARLRVSVATFSAIPDDEADDREAIQKCIEQTSRNNEICFIPAGNYFVDGDLWVQDDTFLLGEGEKTVLHFRNGMLRSLKNGHKTFRYINHYINEQIPDVLQASLAKAGTKGEDVLMVIDTAGFEPGDYIYTFNNRNDTWAILENKEEEAKFNGVLGGMSRSEIFRIKGLEEGRILLDKAMRFDMPKGSPVTRHAGSRDITIQSIKVVNNATERWNVLFEQPFNVHFLNVFLEGNGGIGLINHPFRCQIRDSRITSKTFRAVSVQHFGTENIVINNEIHYTTGGDCAVIVMMSAYNNEIAHNKVYGHGEREQFEEGILIHATCYDNRVHHNYIHGASTGMGAYYGAFNNVFEHNVCEQVGAGITCWYAGSSNLFKENANAIKAV